MPIQRKRYVKKRKTTWYNRKYSPYEIAMKAWHGVKAVKGLINAERKIHEASISESPDTNGTVSIISAVLEGDTAYSRNGNSIYVKRIEGTIKVQIHASAGASIVRILLVRDNHYVAGDEDTASLLENVGTTAVVYSRKQDTFFNRYTILKDWTIDLVNNSNKLQRLIKFYVNLRSHSKYLGENVPSFGQYQIYAYSNEDTNKPTVTGITRLSFYDN